jgi:hypothetical protein
MVLSAIFEDTDNEMDLVTDNDFDDDFEIEQMYCEIETDLGAIFEDTDNEMDLVTDNDFDNDFEIEEMYCEHGDTLGKILEDADKEMDLIADDDFDEEIEAVEEVRGTLHEETYIELKDFTLEDSEEEIDDLMGQP